MVKIHYSKDVDDVGRSLGADGGRPTTQKSRGGETARPQEKRQTAIKTGTWEDCVKRYVRKAEEIEKWEKRLSTELVTVPFLGLSGQFGPQVSIFYWPGGPT